MRLLMYAPAMRSEVPAHEEAGWAALTSLCVSSLRINLEHPLRVQMSFPSIRPAGVERESVEATLAEAASRPIEYSPAERAADIRRMMETIPALLARGVTKDALLTVFEKEAKMYPQLFKKIVDGEDLSPIRVMLTMLDKMSEGELTQHQASIIVGDKLLNKYVRPQLDAAGVRPGAEALGRVGIQRPARGRGGGSGSGGGGGGAAANSH